MASGRGWFWSIGRRKYHLGTQGNTSVTGKITATSGSIGGFEIGDGRIGVTESIEMDGKYQGLTILSSFIKYHIGRSLDWVWCKCISSIFWPQWIMQVRIFRKYL